MSEPLVTCLCLTTAVRKEWLKRAVDCFCKQNYDIMRKELMIIPDAWEDVPDDLLSLAKHYEDMSIVVAGGLVRRNVCVGEKRNIGCRLARGGLIAIWDDDDFSAPGRLSQQVKELEITGKAVTGYRMMKFSDGSNWWQFTIGKGFVIGSSLMFKRSWWEEHPFPEIQIGEEAAFCQAAHEAKQLAAVPDLGLMYASIHEGNTSKKDLTNPQYRPLPGFSWPGDK